MAEKSVSKISLLQFLPNFCTTMTLFFGFLSATSSSLGQFNKACICIIIAWVADCLDGRVARMTGNESEFGKEYDSLADLIAFGLAPAMLSYRWLLIEFHKVGWCLAFIYVAATALRLARFNTESGGGSFKGLPCPGAAAVIVSYIWLMISMSQTPIGMYAVFTILQVLLVSFLMISNIEFKHLKHAELPRKYRLFVGLTVGLLFCAILINPPLTLYVMALVYAGYGFIFGLLKKGSCLVKSADNTNNKVK